VDAPDLRPATRKRRPDTPQPAPTRDDAAEVPGEVGARLAALDSTIRALSIRMDALERESRMTLDSLRAQVAAGFDEATARALVMSEATEELLGGQRSQLDRVESLVAQLPTEVPEPPAPVDLSGVESAIASLSARVDALPAEVPEPPAPVDLSGVQSAVEGFASKLAPLQATADAVAELKAVVGALASSIDAIQPDTLRSELQLVAERLSSLVGGPSLSELMDRHDDVDRRLAAIEEHLRNVRLRPTLRPGTAGDAPRA
jgi:hypothetical protein